MDDQLIESDYLGRVRLRMHDCAVLGAGAIKGPIVVNRVRKARQPLSDSDHSSGIHALEIVVGPKPASERADPWYVFPDQNCGEDNHTGRGVFEKKTYTSKQFRELAKQPRLFEGADSRGAGTRAAGGGVDRSPRPAEPRRRRQVGRQGSLRNVGMLGRVQPDRPARSLS